MKSPEARLVRHLAIAVVLKLLVLAVLWWAFVRGERVDVNAERSAARIGATAHLTGARP